MDYLAKVGADVTVTNHMVGAAIVALCEVATVGEGEDDCVSLDGRKREAAHAILQIISVREIEEARDLLMESAALLGGHLAGRRN